MNPYQSPADIEKVRIFNWSSFKFAMSTWFYLLYTVFMVAIIIYFFLLFFLTVMGGTGKECYDFTIRYFVVVGVFDTVYLLVFLYYIWRKSYV